MPGRLLPFVRSTPASSPPEKPNPVKDPKDGRRDSKSSPLSRMEHLKRHSIVGKPNKSADKTKRQSSSSPARAPAKPANKLEVVFESPPNIFYGPAASSTGALFSGRLKMVIVDPQVTLESFTMQLIARITTKKPVSKDCPDCQSKTTALHKWTFIREPKHLKSGEHEFPFSYLLPGHLPITTHGQMGVLEYFLDAKATTTTKETLTLHQPLPVYRAMQAAQDKDSLRLFPPTNLTTRITMPPIIHPIGDFNVLIRVDGITATQGTMQTRWRLRKMFWKLEETETMISPACPKHAAKLGGENKGVKHEDVRTIGQEELRDGWKTDLSNGTIELEFKARPLGTNRPLCDVESPTGLVITHTFVIELVVAEEIAQSKAADRATPTGAARVLRMTIPLKLMERPGMGISWDEEQPPMYEDVPASPPMYAQGVTRNRDASIHDYTGPPLSPPPTESTSPLDSEVERLHLGEPSRALPGSSTAASSSGHRAGEAVQPAGASARRRLAPEDFE